MPASPTPVLCVDDEPVILHILRRLSRFRASRRSYAAIAGAWRFGDGDFDVVITDIHMPGMDGLALMRALRERQPDSRSRRYRPGTVTRHSGAREGATGC